ncbi:MAG: HAMP domain-containing histidine kinase [Tepidibacter sp.]|jgi:signal transduction histidine kinase|uniref:HAMP domain-containing sensor histidine kinase n=1 Tax=Tepidibacter sp. TaxID=2529387 RepID=UPI0025D27458|nr:HAMP domain-containing sensor histidine kinase [Tepidibacter sp.]MCT4509333.1 HAMP domain-containing histidine kinase [Tepidibacter sp.]
MKNKYSMIYIRAFSFIFLGFLFSFFTSSFWFNVIVKIRESIYTGDSGHLILASAYSSILFSIQSTLFFLGTISLFSITIKKYKISSIGVYAFIIVVFFILNKISDVLFVVPWEPITMLIGLFATVILLYKQNYSTFPFIQAIIIAIQVFFAFQWLNIMPIFSFLQVGQSDISISIKIAGEYLKSESVLNFIGFSFFLPFTFSASITASLFISYAHNIVILQENHKKERDIQIIKSKAMENKIYQEINSLAHDLKTPLVTVRGLNSLIPLCNDTDKLIDYSQRIEGAITKMSEMISSFLYSSSRQQIKVEDLIQYIQAQIPIEDETLNIDIDMENQLPLLYVNKVRVVRALINIVENAIVVPCIHEFKHITIKVRQSEDGVKICIYDNGIGIESSNLENIWEIGYSTSKTSGLGLPFAKQIIEDHNGNIKIKSNPDGTVVTVYLPSANNTQNKRGDCGE